MENNNLNNDFKEIYFETYGCTANKNSSEIMKGLVRQAGLNTIQDEKFADLIVINTCIVKSPTEEKIRRRIQDLLKKYPNKKIVIAGCMPRFLPKNLKEKNNLYLLDIHHIKDIINLLQDIRSNQYKYEKYLKPQNEVKASLPKISDEKFIGITQISEGCLGECSYCVVRFAKGKLFSYPKEKIIENISNDLGNGCKEILLTSQDNASYGKEEGKFLLPELLKEIVEIPGNFYMRIGMMNPNNLIKILPEMIELYKNKKIFKFLHIPTQSGSDKVLKEMNRKYQIKDILKIVDEFRKQIPEILISTDIIVGYPTETDKDFEDTLSLIQKIKPEILNRSNFYPRQETSAKKLKEISTNIMNERSSKLMKLHLDICNEIQKPFLGKELKVLVDKKGFSNTYLARDKSYKLFAIQSTDKSILGKEVNIKVKKAMPHYLLAELAVGK